MLMNMLGYMNREGEIDIAIGYATGRVNRIPCSHPNKLRELTITDASRN